MDSLSKGLVKGLTDSGFLALPAAGWQAECVVGLELGRVELMFLNFVKRPREDRLLGWCLLTCSGELCQKTL